MSARSTSVPLDGPYAEFATADVGASRVTGQPVAIVRLYGHQVDAQAEITDPDLLLALARDLTEVAEHMADRRRPPLAQAS